MFENIKFGPCGTDYQEEEDEFIKIWEKPDVSATASSLSKIVAVTFCKPSGDCWIQIHPDYRFVEEEIVLWMENQGRVTISRETPELGLRFYVDETDETLSRIRIRNLESRFDTFPEIPALPVGASHINLGPAVVVKAVDPVVLQKPAQNADDSNIFTDLWQPRTQSAVSSDNEIYLYSGLGGLVEFLNRIRIIKPIHFRHDPAVPILLLILDLPVDLTIE